MLLPEAFRSLSRLSSALSAKASTLRSLSLDLPVSIALEADGQCCLVYKFISFRCLLYLTFNVFLDIFVYAIFKVHDRLNVLSAI